MGSTSSRKGDKRQGLSVVNKVLAVIARAICCTNIQNKSPLSCLILSVTMLVEVGTRNTVTRLSGWASKEMGWKKTAEIPCGREIMSCAEQDVNHDEKNIAS